AAAKTGNNYLFAVACATTNIVALTASDPVKILPSEQDKGVSNGLSIEFDAPSEFAPIVSHPKLEINAIVTGLQGKPSYSIDIAGRSTDEGSVEVSDNKDLVVVPAPPDAGSAGPPIAIKLADGSVRLSQDLTLYEGPNRIKVTVHDGSKQVTAVKTVCYIPGGDLDKGKIYSTSHAIVIGINKYTGKNSKNIPGLSAAVADATDVAKVLKDQYGFQDVQTLTDADATHEKIEKTFHALADAGVVKPNDRVVIFWSGHGQTVTTSDGGQVGFLLPSDAQVDFSNLDNARPYLDTCVAMTELSQLAREIPAKHVLILVDACFSGLAARTGSANPTGVFQLVHKAYFDAKEIITASSGSETAKEANGHGYFTKALLDAFQDPAADENKDGYLEADELYHYLLPKVQQANSSQSPQMARFSLGIGETLFFK
ncbi:MAG TPA: caspase family protein, partial [Fimbriimonadaceae bacterium]|nr:caspase family protein [Fimbriimonadaceae bacterium]